MVAEVYINRGAKKLNKTFDYNIPSDLEDLVFIGSKVIVPFGMGKNGVEAFVVKIKGASKYGKLKEILSIDENLPKDKIELARWMAKKYYTNVSECIKLMLAPGTKNKNIEKRIHHKTISTIFLNKKIEDIKIDIENRKVKSEKQIKILMYVSENKNKTITEIEKQTECSSGIIRTLIKNEYLKLEEKIVSRNPLINKNIQNDLSLNLTEEQQYVYDNISKTMEEEKYKSYLIHGVTGSGKTEVYLQLIETTIKKEKSAIVLVPEISLTPQMIDRFIARFGKEKIAVLHSKLSSGERFDEWEKIKKGEANIIIGARSAIFAPIQNLGIIIIDEEHDGSYKSESDPKYDAKEVATFIAKDKNCPLILGSATPDVNTYFNAIEKEEIELLRLTKRANNSSLPKVKIIDLKQELANGNRSMFSVELYNMIEKNLKEKKQTILFLNRRGYSTFIMCRDCGYTVTCPNCNISMTYHNTTKKLICHYCGHEKQIPKICPECQSTKIRYFGTGTQKLEEEILKQFPNCKTIRMDIDTVNKKNSHEEILNEFKNNNIDILIGTQMVVKGHHFPNVTLVGVIAADGSLNIDDYRANERTFQILTQVAGRAGRENLAGNVIIQTYNPDNFSILCAQKHDYNEFYETEIMLRKQLKYPPFCDIIVIGINGTDENKVIENANNTYEYMKNHLDLGKYLVFKPMPSPIDKIQNRYRWRVIIKGMMTSETNNLLNSFLNNIYQKDLKEIKIGISVNPNNMM